MKNYKNILVTLDLSYIDESVINYINHIVNTIDVENVYFLHNIKKDEIADLLVDDEYYSNIENIVEKELNTKVDKFFNKNCNYEVLLSDDNFTESLISYVATKHDIKLVVLGNKLNNKGSGVMIDKLSQLLSCDLLTVPEEYILNNKILVTTDFSKSSLKAFATAKRLSESDNSSIESIHIYNIPNRYAPYFATAKEESRLQNHFEQKQSQFIKKNKLDYVNQFYVKPSGSYSIGKSINEFAKKNQFSLIVVSDKGKNMFSNLLIGSVTSSLLNKHASQPLLVVKTN